MYGEAPDELRYGSYRDSDVKHLKQRIVRAEMARSQMGAKLHQVGCGAAQRAEVTVHVIRMHNDSPHRALQTAWPTRMNLLVHMLIHRLLYPTRPSPPLQYSRLYQQQLAALSAQLEEAQRDSYELKGQLEVGLWVGNGSDARRQS